MRLKRTLHGSEKGADVRMVQRALRRLNFYPLALTGVYDEQTRKAVRLFKRANGLHDDGVFGQLALNELADAFDAYGRWRYRLYRPPPRPKPAWLAIGPLYVGGKSVLDHDLTHATDGLPLFPAFDDAFKVGTPIIAPEPMTVDTKHSSSNPGHAFYTTGASTLRYWCGHLDRDWPLGTTFKRGQLIGHVAPNDIGGGPHVHWGINAEAILGKGRELEHHTNYTHGAPTVREQLERALL